MATSRNCKHDPNSFCYVCGVFLSSKSVKYKITESMNTFFSAYKAYFGVHVGDQDKKWAPHVVCGSCRSTLEAWYRGEHRKMTFGVPRIWREPTDYLENCYFCVIDVAHHRKGKKTSIFDYPDMPSSLRPVAHCDELPVPLSLARNMSSSSRSESNDDQSQDEDFSQKEDSKPHFPTQQELNDLIRDIGLTKSNAEILTSRLQEWNLLDKSCKVSEQRKRHASFSQFFTLRDQLCYCHNVGGLFKEIGFSYDPRDWRLFIDSSSKSLKAVLLHNGNKYPSIPIAHSASLKENYANVKRLLQAVTYDEHMWDVIGDFKMITFLVGLQGGYTKNPCFLCLWDSRDDARHYETVSWPARNEFVVGERNIRSQPLVKQDKILMPPLHIKLGLIKQFVKALDPNSEAFHYLKTVFPKLSEAKIRGGIFVGPQVRRLMLDDEFMRKLQPTEKDAWKSFIEIVNGFLGNHKVPNYEEVVLRLLRNYQAMGCRMSLKLHVLHSHLSVFKANMGQNIQKSREKGFIKTFKSVKRGTRASTMSECLVTIYGD